jgi:sigma-B regulation protein RsbU (phosphoserine phosphatase)
MIADVSGSGMPAALFMAKTNTLLNTAIKQSDSPRVILSYVNSELCKNNKECYFVTIALYCIDLKTRKVVSANSGHEDSIIIKNNNEIVIRNEIRSAPMGLDEYNNYSEEEFVLDEGDILFLYTDGVVEAINKDKELFGIDRLTNELKSLGPIDTKSIVTRIEQKLGEFASGVEQFDDITMLCFKFKQLNPDENKIFRTEKSFNAVYENVEEVDKFIEECLDSAYDDNSIYKKYLSQFNICVEEIVVNICDYAYDTENDIKNSFFVKVLIDKNVDKLSISFIDSGKAFDPTAMKDVNILQGVD